MDLGPGLMRAFFCQLWTLLKGVGRRARALVRASRTLVDALAEAGVVLYLIFVWILFKLFFKKLLDSSPSVFRVARQLVEHQ